MPTSHARRWIGPLLLRQASPVSLPWLHQYLHPLERQQVHAHIHGNSQVQAWTSIHQSSAEGAAPSGA